MDEQETATGWRVVQTEWNTNLLPVIKQFNLAQSISQGANYFFYQLGLVVGGMEQDGKAADAALEQFRMGIRKGRRIRDEVWSQDS